MATTTATHAPRESASGIAIPLAMVDFRDGHLYGIRCADVGEPSLDSCDCHRDVWPADMLTYVSGIDIWECPLP